MARPCFPIPFSCTIATIWDGTTRFGNSPSGSSSSLTPVVGPYTGFPVGMSLVKLCELLFRVRLWKASINFDGTITVDVPPDSNSIPITGTGDMPMIQGKCTTETDTLDHDQSYFYDRWADLRESGGGILSSSDVIVENVTDGNAIPFSGNTTNYTASELNDMLTIDAPYADIAITIGGQNNRGVGVVLYCDGLYYPEIGFFIRFSEILSNSIHLGSEDFEGSSGYDAMDATGTLTINLPSGNISIPAKSSALYLGYDIAFVGTFDITVTAVKYWPYKDTAGTALYDETTGELVP